MQPIFRSHLQRIRHSVAAVAWSIVYSYSPLQAVRLAFVMILRDYLLIGVLSATLLWFVTLLF